VKHKWFLFDKITGYEEFKKENMKWSKLIKLGRTIMKFKKGSRK